MRLIRLAAPAFATMLSGCVALDVYQAEPARSHLAAEADSARARCIAFFRDLDAAADASDTRDALWARVAGFPYLRVDRFLSSFSGAAMSAATFSEWVARMRRLDDEARAVEIANFPYAGRMRPFEAVPAPLRTTRLAEARRCAEQLAGTDLGDETGRARLRAAARVPPDYDTWKRVIGLYPLTLVFFASGVRRWQDETRAAFAAEPRTLGRLVRYVPADRRLPTLQEESFSAADGATGRFGSKAGAPECGFRGGGHNRRLVCAEVHRAPVPRARSHVAPHARWA